MGAERRTTPHLEVVRVVPDQNLLLVRGAIPGATGGLVLVKKSVKLSKAQQKAVKKA
jgi:large subunit ribosomal protein L3